MTITQETARLSADFSRFNIAAPETVRAIQPDSASVALFRVLGNDPSAIYGKLIANGQVFLSNPNGILFGKGAQVDVGGLVATTMNIDQADFMAGRNRFHGGTSGSVINEGGINVAERGYVAMLAPEVRNDGIIVARLGTVVLGAGQAATLDFAGNGKVNLQIDQGVLNGRVGNRQAIIAEGGQVIMSAGARDALLSTVVNNEGVVEARRISQEGGVIRLEGGAVTQSGRLDAGSAEGRGGSIALAGSSVTLVAGSTTDASGATGGGTILIGGDYQGANPDFPNAVTTRVEASATIRADARVQGDGGKVIVWSDQHTGFLGTLSAKGGAQGGNGGFAEVSGKDVLDYRGHADLTAPLGKSGTLLLDPRNINIVATGAGAVASNNEFVENPAGTSSISGATLAAAINSASVVLQANNNITFNDNVTATSAGNGLSLQAGRSISFSAGKQLSLNGGDFTASINDDAARLANRGVGAAQFTMAAGSSITTNGGAITIGGGDLDGTGARQMRFTGSTLDAGTGNIRITGAGRSAASNALYGVLINGAVVRTSSGDISITGTGGAGINSNHGVYLRASATADALVTTTSGDIDIIGTGGNGGNSNLGVYLAGNGAARKAQIQSTTGSVRVTGTGQGSGKNNRGVQVAGGGEITTGGSGTITLSGTGTMTPGATSGNHGVFLNASTLAGSLVQTLGSGGVTVTGTGGQGTSSNYGVVLSGNGAAMKATLRSASGAINVTGNGGNGSGSSNRGVGLLGGGRFLSSSGGGIAVNATGANGANGFFSNGVGGNGLAGSGAVSITASGGNARNPDFKLGAGDAIGGNGAPVTIIADRMSIGGAIVASAGQVMTLRPKTAGRAVNLGSLNDSSASALELSSAELDRVTGGSLVLGSTVSGDLIVSSSIAPTVSSLSLVSGGRFINDHGPNALTVGTGRWLVYSSTPANDTRNGLAYDFKQYGATFGDSVLGSGNGFLYSLAPALAPGLTGTASKTYDGSTTATLAAGNYLTGAIDGDTVTLSGTGVYDSKDVGVGKQVSVSGISIASAVNGNATVYGYQLAATAATGNIGTISQALLNVIADDKSKTAGQPNPIFTAGYSGFVPGEGPGVLTGALNLASTATTLSPVGAYPITPSGLGAANYAISYQAGTLRVDPANTGGNEAGIREIVGILGGAPIAPVGVNPVDALNALPGTAAGGEGGEAISDLLAPPFVAGNVAVVVCGIALPAGVAADKRCQSREFQSASLIVTGSERAVLR